MTKNEMRFSKNVSAVVRVSSWNWINLALTTNMKIVIKIHVNYQSLPTSFISNHNLHAVSLIYVVLIYVIYVICGVMLNAPEVELHQMC